MCDSLFNSVCWGGGGGGSIIINNNNSCGGGGGSSQWSNSGADVYILSNVAIGSNNTTFSKLYVDGTINNFKDGTFTVLPSIEDWSCLTSHNETFITLAYGTDKGAYSSNGTIWSSFSIPVTGNWYSVTSFSSNYIAVSYNSNISIYSVDGINWNTTNLPTTDNWYLTSIDKNSGKVVTIARDSNAASYSTDNGISWTNTSMPASMRWSSLTWNNDKFVSVSYTNVSTTGNTFAYSSDGIVWSQSSTPPSSRFWTCVSSNPNTGVFLTLSSSSSDSYYATSYDGGNTWTQGSLPYDDEWFYLACNSTGRFVGIAYGSNKCIYSDDDGTTWNLTYLPYAAEWGGLSVNSNDRFLLVEKFNNLSIYSDDGVIWSRGYGSVITNDIIVNGKIFNTEFSNTVSNVTSLQTSNTLVWSNIFWYQNSSNIYSNNGKNVYIDSNLYVGQTINTTNNLTVNGKIFNTEFSNTVSNVTSLQTSNTLVWSNINQLRSNIALGGAISDETTTLTTANFTNIRAPYSFVINRPPLFWLNVLPTVSSNTVFDILKNGVSIYSIKPQIGAGTTSNVSANSVPGTLIGGSNNVSQYDLLTIDVDVAGSGNPAGAKFIIYCS